MDLKERIPKFIENNSLLLVDITIFTTIFAIYNTVYKSSFSVAIIFFILTYVLTTRINIKENLQTVFFNKIVCSSLFFISCLLISSLFSYDIAKSMKLSIDYFIFMLPFFIILHLSFYGKITQPIYWGLICSLLFINMHGIYQYTYNLGFGSDFFSIPISLFFPINYFGNIESIFGNRNLFATILSMSIPFAFASTSHIKNNILYIYIGYLTIILSIVMLFITGSRGAIGGFVIANIIFFTWKNISKKHFIIYCASVFLIVSIVITFFAPTLVGRIVNTDFNKSDKERLLLFKSSYAMWKDYPLFGVGLGNFQYFYKTKYILPEAKAPNLGGPHNTLLQYLSESGIIGSIGFWIMNIYIFLFFYKKYLHSPDNKFLQAILIVSIYMFIHGLVDLIFLYTTRPSVRLYWAFAAIAYQSTIKKCENKK